jgi:dTDP-4-dehydrorhamnose reductase
MRVLVLGHRGMLGHVVARRFAERGHEVITTDFRYDGESLPFLGWAEAVVNCAGVVTVAPGLMVTNVLLPLHLAGLLEGRTLVHPSTDCVFDGLRGRYAVNEPPNSTDPYGLSKRLGEGCATQRNVYVLRTSIVGPPGDGGRGLLGWFLRQDGPVDGWVDHRWNGTTTLAWADLAAGIVEGSPFAPGLHQPATEDEITKYALLELFGGVFDHRIEVRPVETGMPVDRTLIPTIVMPPLEEQLAELDDWMAR